MLDFTWAKIYIKVDNFLCLCSKAFKVRVMKIEPEIRLVVNNNHSVKIIFKN